MRTVSIFLLVVHLSIQYIPALGAYNLYILSCYYSGCLCSGTNRDMLQCNFTQSVFYFPKSIVLTIKHLKITGTSYTVYIPDRIYDSSWSVLESFEIYGHGGNRQQLTLPYQFTKRLSRIKLLRIRNAGLVSIDKHAFSNMSAMEHLDLSNNEFLNKKEVEDAFSGYTANRLQTLNISGIHSSKILSPFTNLVLYPLTSLLNLDVSWTKAALIHVHKSFSILPNLVTLNISGTYQLERTNCSHPKLYLKNLKNLRMDYWPVGQFHDTITPLLPCSIVFVFEYGCYHLPYNLKELNLNHVHAKKLEIDFEKNICILSRLEHLYLRNLIVSGPVGKITGLQHLKSIDISNTMFPFNIQLFLDMPSVEVIDASGNSLHKIENETGFVDMFAKNLILKEIVLRENGFLELPDKLFSRNKLLESIDISRNKLQYLKLNLTACSHLHKLSVADNRLKMIDSSVTNHLDSLVNITNNNRVSITIDGIELTCDCGDAKLVTWIQRTNVMINEKGNFTCNTSENQNFINDFNSKALNCSNGNKISSDIAIPDTMTGVRKTELFYIAGGVLGSGLCALCLVIAIVLKRKYASHKLQELQECPLHERTMENDEHSEIISNSEELQMISNDKEPPNNDREMLVSESANISNDNKLQTHGPKSYKREVSVPVPENNVSAVYHRQLSVPVSASVSDDVDLRNNISKTHKKPVSVPDSIYFIGLTETPFESINRKPHFAAFLAYSHHDKDFVVTKLYKMLQRHLEKYIPSWNQELLTVLYDKNFLPGQCTMDLTRAAVFSSYVTVAIVSDSFIKSTWCHYEMEAAIEAKVPIISVYLPSSDTDKFPAILKYIYHNHVRIFWPDTDDNLLKLSDEEAGIIRDLAFSISTYVKHPIP